MKCDRCDFAGLPCVWVSARCALCPDCLTEIFGKNLQGSNAPRYILIRAGYDFRFSEVLWQGFNTTTKNYNQPIPLSPQLRMLLDDPKWFRKMSMNRLVCVDNIQEFILSAPFPCIEGIWVRKRILGAKLPVLNCFYIEDEVVCKEEKKARCR